LHLLTKRQKMHVTSNALFDFFDFAVAGIFDFFGAGMAQIPSSDAAPTALSADYQAHDDLDITDLLAQARAGDNAAWGRVVRQLYGDLKRMASAALRAQPERALDTTGLVGEWYLRLAASGQVDLQNRGHFFALAAKVMRQVICAYAREKFCAKRGAGQQPSSLEAIDFSAQEQLHEAQQFVFLDDALAALAKHAPRQAQIVECRFFAGLSEQQTAEALQLSLRTVQREWALARAWLEQEAVA
jgi:RNA polymerase sigma factor (TIGR02999 family)